MGDPNILKKKLIVTFTVIILLIICSGILGWFFTGQIEKSGQIIDVVHSLKESELQLRKEEKNLLIRGYSQERYLRWQKAKEDFHRSFGELMGRKALNENEINTLKTDYSEMSDTYNKFFHKIRSTNLSQDELAQYDEQFKEIGRRTLKIINDILSREENVYTRTDSQADILIVIFVIVFVATTGFLIVNVIKHL
jgi:hypothetical protein